MSSAVPAPRVFLPWAERPLAYLCLVLATATLVWKTVGLGFVPGWDDMFGTVGAQYPRRVAPMAPAWSLAYLAVYGVLGSAATAAGVLLTRRRGALASAAGPRVRGYARIVGLFHSILGMHHTLWAVTAGRWGHLSLEQFSMPSLYVFGGVAGFAAGLHGFRLLASTTETPTYQIVRSKIAVDGVSCLTFSSVVVCFARNAMGLPRDHGVERVAWIAVFVGPFVWVLADWIHSWAHRRPEHRP